MKIGNDGRFNLPLEQAMCLSSFPRSMKGNFFQSVEYRRVLHKIGWETLLLKCQEQGCEASALIYLPKSLSLVSHLFRRCRVFYGPCIRTSGEKIDFSVLDLLLKKLSSVGEQLGATFLAVRAPFPFEFGSEIFGRNGFTKEASEGAYSVVIDLDKSLDTVWGEMKRFARRCIKKSIDFGVEIREIETEDDLREFYGIYLSTTARRGFEPYPFQLFRILWRELEPEGLVKFFVASWRNKPIAGILNTFYDQESVPYVACSVDSFWRLHPNHLLFWHSIKYSKEIMGSSIFKLYHVTPKRERVKGVDYFTFKTCFGGQLLEECAFYTKIISPSKFRVYRFLTRINENRTLKRLARHTHIPLRHENHPN